MNVNEMKLREMTQTLSVLESKPQKTEADLLLISHLNKEREQLLKELDV